MTVVLSIALPEFSSVAIDSAVTYYAEDGSSTRKIENKIYALGNSYVAAWGDLLGSRRMLIDGAKAKVGDRPDAIAGFLLEHLQQVEQPKEEGSGHLGYHVGGIDAGGRARLFNIFWEPPNTQPSTPPDGRYGSCDHTPGTGPSFVFNGRHDIAELPVRALVNEVRSGRETKFNVRHPDGALRFGDLAIRFAASISPDVGLPVRLLLIAKSGKTFAWTNRMDRPLPREFDRSLRRVLRGAG